MFNPKTVSIVGYGRFGKTLHRLLNGDFSITLYNRSPLDSGNQYIKLYPPAKIATDIQNIYQSEVIFYCVPIDEFANVINEHKKYFTAKNLLIDTLSVKMYAETVLRK